MTGGHNDIQHVPADYAAVLAGLPPLPLAPGPVHLGGSSATDATMAAFGAATNADLPDSNTELADDDIDRRGHAADAIGKFAANESAATTGFGGVGAEESAAMSQQLPQAMSGAVSTVVGALGGALGALGRIPQELMQAGQGAIQPLMSALQTGSGDLGDDAELVDADTPDSTGPGLDGFDSGSGGLTPAIGTTPAGPLGPPPVPASSAPTVPAAAATKTVSAPGIPAAGAPGPGAPGGGMMPLLPGAGGGADKSGRAGSPEEKRIAAPPVVNGQPVKGRSVAAPNIAVTRSAAAKPIPPLVTRKHVTTDDEASR